MKRRTFIVTTIGVGIAVSAPFLYTSYRKSEWSKQPLIHPLMLSYFCDEEAIREIGNSYRKIIHSENAEAPLLSLLLPESDGNRRSLPNLSVERSRLETKIHDDFITNNTIQINGWILSVTEARQCALLSLT